MSSADVPVFVSVSEKEKERCGGERERSSVREFYRNRNVLVTGATGFLGKVLIEKLLRSCEDIGTIYLIIRPKKGSTPEERLQKLLSLKVFNRLHAERPTARNKLVAIEGDLSKAKFILNERDKSLIDNGVSVVFHSAANVKFDEELKEAVKVNLRGTKHIIDLARSMKNLKAFVYISTAYSNCDKLVIEEKYYEPKAPKLFWQDLITAAENIDEKELNALTPGLNGKLPNTYTFTKQMAESMVYHFKDEIPIVVYRPSIVSLALFEPFPGWVDNFNAPIALALGFYTGFLRMVLMTKHSKQDYINVDYAVNGAIAAAWQRNQQPPGKCLFYNCATGKYAMSMQHLSLLLEKSRYKVPTEKTIWKPRLSTTTSIVWFQIHFYLFNLIPAFIVDIGLRASGIKFSLVKLCRKIIVLTDVLSFFTLTTFDIKNDNMLQLYDNMSEEDKKTFSIDVVGNAHKTDELLLVALMGIKEHVLKDNMNEEYIEKLRHRAKYYDWADMAVRIIFFAIVTNVMWNYLKSYLLIDFNE